MARNPRSFRVYDPLYALALCASLVLNCALVYPLSLTLDSWFGAFPP